MTSMTPPAPESAPWQGINHLALVTPDTDVTVRFGGGGPDQAAHALSGWCPARFLSG